MRIYQIKKVVRYTTGSPVYGYQLAIYWDGFGQLETTYGSLREAWKVASGKCREYNKNANAGWSDLDEALIAVWFGDIPGPALSA